MLESIHAVRSLGIRSIQLGKRLIQVPLIMDILKYSILNRCFIAA